MPSSDRFSWDPWGYARAVFELPGDAVFYHSSLDLIDASSQSILAWGEKGRVVGQHFSDLAPQLTGDQDCFEAAWFGYFSYELHHDLEQVKELPAGSVEMPRLSWRQFNHHLVFDHATQKVRYFGIDSNAVPNAIPNTGHTQPIRAQSSKSLISQSDYVGKIERLKADIVAGDLLQSNLTRKVVGVLAHHPDPVASFAQLCETSPATYSALLRLDDDVILSSSPEQFLTISSSGQVETSPIKGTIHRGKTPAEDAVLIQQLSDSQKDRSENLMIVDLCRNDLSRACEPGSIAVSKLFEIQSLATVHHMVSTIRGQKQSSLSALDVVKAAFPPGSMTGAPKVMAMQKASALEAVERGVYSGAIGWFGGDGSCDLSVVIRTLIIRGTQYEYQVGGAITADSDPQSEWQETQTKATALINLLSPVD